jgi:hypothetical protein
MTLHKITEFYTELFSVYLNITLTFRIIAIFKNCVKQNNCLFVCSLFNDAFSVSQTI